MNGPLKMYQTRQIIKHDFAVKTPTCMYKIKNIHEKEARNDGSARQVADHVSLTSKLDIFEQNSLNTTDMSSLEQRQEQILKQLSELKKQMLNLRRTLNITGDNGPSVKTINGSVPLQFPDIIINASPTNPPYSLILLQKLWQKYLHLEVICYTHSTVQSLPPNTLAFMGLLMNFKPNMEMPKVTVRLIWKDIEVNPQLVVSHLPVLGEVNILRYFARVVPHLLHYENCPEVLKIDSVLDVCYQIVNAGTKTERSALMQAVNKNLGKSQYLCDRSEMSIADVAAFSAIKQAVPSNEINVNVKKWMQRCEA